MQQRQVWKTFDSGGTDGWKTLVGGDQKFKINYPKEFEATKREFGFIFQEPIVTSSEYTSIHVLPYNEESSKLFLSWIAQVSVISKSDGMSILSLPEDFSYFSNGNNQGYRQDDGQFYSIYILVNNRIWRFSLYGGDTGSSYTSDGVDAINKMIASFEIEEEIDSNKSDPQKISSLLGNHFSMDSGESEKLIYNFLDILSFEYPKESTVKLSNARGVYVTDNQPSSIPIAGGTLNIRLSDSLSTIGREDCPQEQFLSGMKFDCQNHSYIFLSHKGQNISIDYPKDKYKEIAESMGLL